MKKSIFNCSMIIASLSMTSTYLTVAKADTNQSADQTTDTLDVSSSQNYNEENNKDHETAPAGATVFARNSSKGPGYYKLPSKSDYLFGNSLSATPAQQEAFLAKVKAGAMDGWKKYKILPSVTAAQTALESGWGQNISGKNNFLGIKGQPGTLCWTQEDGPNGTYSTQAYFKDFASFSDCLEYHNILLGTNPIYKPVVGQRDYTKVTAYLQGTYATSKVYTRSLNGIISSFGLTSWDQEAFNETDFPHAAVDTSVITIKYIQNYGVLAFNDSGASIGGSNKTFIDGTKWQTAGSKIINGEEMYQVSPNEYIPKQYTTIGADGTVTINYTQGYGVLGYHLNGASIPGSNQTLKTGSVWKTSGAATINGQIMYKIATDEYVPKEFTQFGNGK